MIKQRTAQCILAFILISALCRGFFLLPELAFGSDPVTLHLSDHMSEELLSLQAKVEPGDSVMSFLRRHVRLDTSSGGSFVIQIAGHPALPKMGCDWFYYVNGLMAEVGAAARKLNPGDHLWWDYHCWENGAMIPGVIGAYPQPFLSQPGQSSDKTSSWHVQILHSPELEREALDLFESLQHAGVLLRKLSSFQPGLISKAEQPIIVLAPWNILAIDPYIKEAHENWGKTGFAAEFSATDRICPRDWHGNSDTCFADSSVILSLPGPRQGVPLWIVSGTDARAVQDAVEFLCKRPNELRGNASLLITQERVIGLPLRHKITDRSKEK